MPDISSESSFGWSGKPQRNARSNANGSRNPGHKWPKMHGRPGRNAAGKHQNRPNSNARPAFRAPQHIVELRELMHEQGVLIVSYIVDSNTRTLLQSVHLESRGLMLPQDGKSLHSEIVSRSREFYEVALQDIPDIEPKDLNRLLKQDIEKLLKGLLGRMPCVIVLIHSL